MALIQFLVTPQGQAALCTSLGITATLNNAARCPRTPSAALLPAPSRRSVGNIAPPPDFQFLGTCSPTGLEGLSDTVPGTQQSQW